MSHITQHYNNEEDIWRDAWRIADPGAANPVAVARTLFAASAFLNHSIGTDGVKKHPALRVMAGQLSSLYNVDSAGADTDDYSTVRIIIDVLSAGHSLDEGKIVAESMLWVDPAAEVNANLDSVGDAIKDMRTSHE